MPSISKMIPTVKELSQIRVSDICKAADINRSTFYTNYNDVYDLSDRLKERLRQEVSGMLREQLLLNPVQGDFKELFLHMNSNSYIK